MAGAKIVTTDEPQWFLGTLVRPKLTGADTGGRFALWEGLMPRNAAPPLHTHPEDETFYVIEGRVTVWAVEDDATDGMGWVETHATPCEAGAAVHVPGGIAHTFRVESDTARMLFLSTPAGIEGYIASMAEPAAWPWLQPPADGPRLPMERIAEADRAHGVVRVGPPPPLPA
jgi:quercetin dioxygenase-like cupin family protein